MKRLYEVNITFYVVAENAEQAGEVAARESVCLDGVNLDVYGPVNSVRHGWERMRYRLATMIRRRRARNIWR